MGDKKVGKCAAFLKFLWNSETKEFLGRTGLSWLRIFIFYVIFYASLAAFWGLMLYVFFLTMKTSEPKYEGDSSLIGTNPGMGFRPRPSRSKNAEHAIIWYQKGNTEEMEFWANQLQQIVTDAKNNATHDSSFDCSDDKYAKNFTYLMEKRYACRVETNEKFLGPCTPENGFGYKFGSPCVLIKLNRIYGWTPDPYEEKIDNYVSTLKGINKKFNKNDKKYENNRIPIKLLEYIEHFWGVKTRKEKEFAMKGVWIHCEGETPVDRENIGHLRYFPSRLMPGYYFPYRRQQTYQSPFVMVHFESITPGVMVSVECRGYAKNILTDRTERKGAVHFEILVD